jgi:superfamily II DNA or RNA helicase
MTIIKILPHDDVFMKVVCDDAIAYEIRDNFTYKAPNYKFHPLYKNKVWNGDILLFKPMTRLMYVGLLPRLSGFCMKNNYHLEFDRNKIFFVGDRYHSNIEEIIKELDLFYKPRDYQTDAFKRCITDQRRLIESPTGSGKSLIIFMVAKYFNEIYLKPEKLRTLIIVPSLSILGQMKDEFIKYNKGKPLDIHLIGEGSEKVTNSDYTIAMWQSIYKLPNEFFNQFDVICADEVHQYKEKKGAKNVLKTLMEKATEVPYRFGFTGTLDEEILNQMTAEGLFGPPYKVTTTRELIDDGTLADLKINVVSLQRSKIFKQEFKKYVYTKDGKKKGTPTEKYEKEIKALISDPVRNGFIMDLSKKLEGNTLILFRRVEEHGKVLYDELKSQEDGSYHTHFIHGGVNSDKRKEIKEIIEKETGHIVVASFGTSSVGWDIKNIHNIILASPLKGQIALLQSIGRGLRKGDNKETMNIYDLVDDIQIGTYSCYSLIHGRKRIEIYRKANLPFTIHSIDL